MPSNAMMYLRIVTTPTATAALVPMAWVMWVMQDPALG